MREAHFTVCQSCIRFCTSPRIIECLVEYVFAQLLCYASRSTFRRALCSQTRNSSCKRFQRTEDILKVPNVRGMMSRSRFHPLQASPIISHRQKDDLSTSHVQSPDCLVPRFPAPAISAKHIPRSHSHAHSTGIHSPVNPPASLDAATPIQPSKMFRRTESKEARAFRLI